MASENKDEMAKHSSWSEGILGDKAAPSAVAYSWIDRNVPVSGRTHMLLADLTAGVHARNPSLSVQQAVLAAAKDMVQKGVATSDLRTFVEQGGRFSRPGAPDTFAVEDKDEMGEQAEFRPGQSVKVLQGNKVVQGVIVKRKYDSLLGGEYYIVELPDPVHRGRIMPQGIPPSRILASRPGAPDTFAVEDRFYFGKGRKERFADDYAAANRRVQSSSELRKYAKIIMSDDWREGADHWRWVATAPTREIVSWAKEIADNL